MPKILTFPLRFLVGWGLSPRLLGLIGITMLVLLRLTVGWHFYTEGVDKLQSGQWDASPFFANARGPFAENFRTLVWDHDGKLRRDVKASEQWFERYRNQVIRGYGFEKPQQQKAHQNYLNAVEQLEQVLEDNRVDLQEYDLGLERIRKMERDPAREQVSSLRGQRESIRRERQAKLQPTLNQIDQIWKNYEVAQNALATAKQKQAHPPIYLRKPPTGFIDTSIINWLVPYFDIAIGLCLLLGLFTPLAALAAAGFLGSVFLSQYPPLAGPSSSYYQLIECMACLVLAGTAAGRFAGLDYFLHLIVRKVWGIQGEEEL